MKYDIRFSDDAERTLKKYRKSNPVAFNKLSKLLIEISENPRIGTGHPEPLTGGNDITCSRRISGKDHHIRHLRRCFNGFGYCCRRSL